ncbi:MAG TPA: IS1182 family transposase [Bacillota bacterium]|jgi:transposase|nr:IS1182 family transposase [Bacillota bacterium]
MRRFRTYQPKQQYLLPPSLDDWLPEDHLARFINEVVDELDLSAIFREYEGDGRGNPPYNPAMMIRVLIYAYSTGVFSSRKIERKLYEDVAFRYLAADNFPDFRTISTFRKRNLQAFEDLFKQVLKICAAAGLVKLGTVAIDGSKFEANASKHKAMSYGRMKQEEERLSKEIAELMKQAEAVDAAEDEVHGDRRGDELPEELAFREKRLAKIREAKKALEEEARVKAEQEAKAKKTPKDDSSSSDDQPPQVDDKAQRNFTDPESRIMKAPAKGTFVQAYNVQTAVDAETQVILGKLVTNSPTDVGCLLPVMDDVEARVGKPKRVVADSGYYSRNNVAQLRKRGIAPVIPPDRIKHSEWRKDGPRGPIPKKERTERARMRRFVRTKRGKSIYRLRQTSVEPVFGQIKSVMGFRRFSLRGLNNVDGEWSLVATVHNLRKLFAHRQRLQLTATTA